jgi:hypothetical protein
MGAMQAEIPRRSLQAFPVLLTRHLCGRETAAELGLDGRVSRFSRALFALGFGVGRTADTVARVVRPGFSTARLATRILGYRLTARFLTNQQLLRQAAGAVNDWEVDPQAPGWMKAIERRLRPRADPAAQEEAPC